MILCLLLVLFYIFFFTNTIRIIDNCVEGNTIETMLYHGEYGA